MHLNSLNNAHLIIAAMHEYHPKFNVALFIPRKFSILGWVTRKRVSSLLYNHIYSSPAKALERIEGIGALSSVSVLI
jgi:hypothetical protein